MKFLKIFGIILLVLVLGFLSIGLFSGKQEYQAEVKIYKPVAEVFALFNDQESLLKWLPEVKSFEPIKETPNKVGSEYKMLIDNQGQVMEMHETLTGYKENEMIEMVFVAGWMTKNNHFTFEKLNEGTLLKASYTVEGNNIFAKSMFAFFGSMFKQIDETNLNRFKDFVESQTALQNEEKVESTI
ncbi:SRPBCC family protein [Marinifilum caeruleilacunae]|uniref:SRPBCC family protein n=1 Tax=Marinifilum caeruleilacunae TaxID=2499076 RepID=A0ABX1WSE8_9BACT|nr:SRPBCC family protein [Marinifilum caeruleilacunae]NOU58998.1 SRPBCC family protein [Marinifilum caeruleilacunae]